MRLLDLFCGAGGAAMGYHRAGFEVVGVDNRVKRPRFPFELVRADALEYGALAIERGGFDAIHASPPCQAFSVLRRANPEADYPDLIEPTRALLESSGLPWVIENVPGAPLHYSIELCGSMFGLGALSGNGETIERKWRQLRRHRRFETSFPILQPPCQHDGEALGVYGGGAFGRHTFQQGAWVSPEVNRRGGYQGTSSEKRAAMQVEWMSGNEINQAIPPAYTELIGWQILDILRREAA